MGAMTLVVHHFLALQKVPMSAHPWKLTATATPTPTPAASGVPLPAPHLLTVCAQCKRRRRDPTLLAEAPWTAISLLV